MRAPATVLAVITLSAACALAGPQAPAFAGASSGQQVEQGESTLPPFPFDTAIAQYLSHRTDVASIALFDDQSGARYGYDSTRSFLTASIVKADILATLLHRGPLSDSEKALAKKMIERSDNDAATKLWWDAGGGPGVEAFNKLVPMPSTIMGAGGDWAFTQTTPQDQIALVRVIAYQNPLLSNPSRHYELRLMSNVIPAQDWGISAGVPSGSSVALKNGWFLAGGTWHINSIGYVVGGGLDYTIAVLTTNNPSEAYGIETIEGLSRLIVPLLARPAPSVTSGSAGSLDLARRTGSGDVEHLSWSSGGGWSAPSSLGGSTIGAPALVATSGLDLFARDESRAELVWRRQNHGSWSSWRTIPGQTLGWATSSVAGVASADGSVRLFVRGPDGALWTDVVGKHGTWSGWSSFGGSLDSAPAACMSADGVVTVGIVGMDGSYWTATLDGGTWSGWTSRGGLVMNGEPGIACAATGVELFARGVDQAIWSRTLSGTWTSLGGTLASGPSATVRGDGLDVVAQGTDGRTYWKTRDGTGHWSPWIAVP